MSDQLKDRDVAKFRFTLRGLGGGSPVYVDMFVAREILRRSGEYRVVRHLAEREAYAQSKFEPYPRRQWPMRMKVERVERTYSAHVPLSEVRYPVPRPIELFASDDQFPPRAGVEVWPR